jgi:quercetin dioxygenase-like cupin family protein
MIDGIDEISSSTHEDDALATTHCLTHIARMHVFVPLGERIWREVAPGVELSVLRPHGSGGDGTTLLVRMAQGAHAVLHHHPGGEETFIISGKLRIGALVLGPGDYLWTPPGVAHSGDAEEETSFFVVLPAGLQVGAAPPPLQNTVMTDTSA